MLFNNRSDAAQLLAEHLLEEGISNGVIVAIPRGGVPMGKLIAERLGFPLDIVLTKKLSHPIHREYAIGAVSLTNRILSDTTEIPETYIEEETHRVRALLQQRYREFYANRKPISLHDKTVIVVDDGVATGLTLLSTIELLKEQLPERIIVAIPVASRSGLQRLESVPFVDKVICLHAPADFRAVGNYYKDFTQVTNEEVVELLKGQ